MTLNDRLSDAASSVGADLVIGMTLAEIFLLLMLVVWWTVGIEGETRAKSATVADVDLESQVKRLTQQVKDLKSDNDELRDRIEHLRDMLGAKGTDAPDLRNAFRDRIAEAKRRGHPRCSHNNLLVEVSVVNGLEGLRLLQDVHLGPGDAGRFTVGHEVSGAGIATFLGSVRKHYESRSPECRFDYRLMYASDTDYRYGRQRYEQHFYAGQVRQSEAR